MAPRFFGIQEEIPYYLIKLFGAKLLHAAECEEK